MGEHPDLVTLSLHYMTTDLNIDYSIARNRLLAVGSAHTISLRGLNIERLPICDIPHVKGLNIASTLITGLEDCPERIDTLTIGAFNCANFYLKGRTKQIGTLFISGSGAPTTGTTIHFADMPQCHAISFNTVQGANIRLNFDGVDFDINNPKLHGWDTYVNEFIRCRNATIYRKSALANSADEAGIGELLYTML